MQRMTLALLCLICLAACAWAQDSGGATAEWNTRQSMAEMSKRLNEVRPILEQLKPEQWMEKGAPDAYVQQHQATLRELDGVDWALNNLAGKPEKLTFAIDAYFRVNAFRGKVGSLAEAVRRYQNPAIAELLEDYFAKSSASQMQLQEYLAELATLKEGELDVMAQEAQRCREQQIRRPGPRRN